MISKNVIYKSAAIFALITLTLFSSVFAANVSEVKFEISLDRDKVAIGETAQLGLTFHGTQSMPAPDIGNIDGLEIRYLGPSTMMTVINGQVSSSVTHMYSVLPLKIGKFQLGPFSFKYKGSNYSSSMVFLDVSAERPVKKEPAEEPINEQLNLDDRLFVTLDLGKNTAFINELIPVKVKLYVYRLNVSDIQLPVFSQEGFSKIEFKEPKQYKENFNGVLFDVLEFKTDIFGTRPGDFTIGPARIKCNVVVKKKVRRTSMDDLFEQDPSARDSFFDDFLARYEKHPVELKSQDLKLDISPLPSEGVPESFMGAVGDYQFIYKASPVKVKMGDPINVTMSVNGTGNFNTVLLPKMDNTDGFRIYEAEVKTSDNSKEFNQVLIPESADPKEVPKAVFSYFDPNKKQYITISHGPIPIEVEKGKDEGPSRMIGPTTPEQKVEEKEDLARDIVYIKESPSKWVSTSGNGYKLKILFILYIVPAFLLLAYYLIVRRVRKIKADSAYAFRLNAMKAAKEGVRTLRREINSKNSKVFYESLFKALQNYLGNRLHMPSAGVTFDTVNEALLAKDVDLDIIRKIKNLFNACDQARFAFMDIDSLRMRDDLKEFEDIVRFLERKKV